MTDFVGVVLFSAVAVFVDLDESGAVWFAGDVGFDGIASDVAVVVDHDFGDGVLVHRVLHVFFPTMLFFFTFFTMKKNRQFLKNALRFFFLFDPLDLFL